MVPAALTSHQMAPSSGLVVLTTQCGAGTSERCVNWGIKIFCALAFFPDEFGDLNFAVFGCSLSYYKNYTNKNNTVSLFFSLSKLPPCRPHNFSARKMLHSKELWIFFSLLSLQNCPLLLWVSSLKFH